MMCAHARGTQFTPRGSPRFRKRPDAVGRDLPGFAGVRRRQRWARVKIAGVVFRARTFFICPSPPTPLPATTPHRFQQRSRGRGEEEAADNLDACLPAGGTWSERVGVPYLSGRFPGQELCQPRSGDSLVIASKAFAVWLIFKGVNL